MKLSFNGLAKVQKPPQKQNTNLECIQLADCRLEFTSGNNQSQNSIDPDKYKITSYDLVRVKPLNLENDVFEKKQVKGYVC
jgi:hypothetical protein